MPEARRPEHRSGDTEFRRLFEALPQGVLFHAPPDGRIVDANPAAEEFLGKPRDDLIGRVPCKTWCTVDGEEAEHTPENHPVMLAMEGKTVRGGLMGVDHPRKDERRWLEADAVPEASPDEEPPYRVFCVLTDVTERQRAKQARSESEERYRTLAELSPDAILVNVENRFAYANQAAARILGTEDPEEIVGRSPFHFVRPEDRDVVRERIEQVLEHESPAPVMEQRWRRLDGEDVPVEVLAGPCTWAGRAAIQVVLRDITRWKEAEKQLVRAKEEAERASRAKTRFLSVMSHELRTPLNAVMGFAELLQAEVLGPLNEVQRDRLGRIRTSAKHLGSIIEDILTFTSVGPGRLELRNAVVRVDRVARDVAEMMEPEADRKGLELRVQDGDEPVRAYTDASKLRQILTNLVQNGLKYTEEGGVEISLGSSEDSVWIVVRDTGRGIPEDRLEDVFHPFVQVETSSVRTTGGAGLGLAVCRELARLLEGEVEVASKPGRGTTFTVHLPRNLEEAAGGKG